MSGQVLSSSTLATARSPALPGPGQALGPPAKNVFTQRYEDTKKRDTVMTTWTPKAVRPNKANSPAWPEGARADTDGSGLAARVHCAKQSQFPSCGKQWVLASKAASGVALRSIVRNKANWPVPSGNGQGWRQRQGRCPGTKRAKQSQFLAEHEER